MEGTYFKKLMKICADANLTYRLKAKGLLVEGDANSNHRIMRLRYLDALLGLAAERFARNFLKAIDGCTEEDIPPKPNNNEKLNLLKTYLDDHGLEIQQFMVNAMVQAYIIYEHGFDEDEIVDSLYLECSPEWVLYGIEELFYRFKNNEFVEVQYFDDAESLIPDEDLDNYEKHHVWTQFAMYILAILDDGVCMQIPWYNHELDEDYNPTGKEEAEVLGENVMVKAVREATLAIKGAFKR